MYSTHSGHCVLLSKSVLKYYLNNIIFYVVSVCFSLTCMNSSSKLGNDAFYSFFMSYGINLINNQIVCKCALLNLDKKNRKLFLRTQQLLIKELIDNRCNALEAAPERLAIHIINAHFPTEN